MALILHQPGNQPLGQFDGYTGNTTNFKGGEVCTWRAMVYPTTGAADVNNDGYVTSTSYGKEVPGISYDWAGMITTDGGTMHGPYFLADDGLQGYGTLFGAVVGGSVGQQVNGVNTYTGAVLGPHTATGSGKVTVWDKQGLYGVTLDAVNSSLTATANVTVGTPLYFDSAGKICLTGQNSLSSPVIGRLASFETNGSLVTTPGSLVAALNSPSGDVSSLTTQTMYQLVFWFGGAGGGV
jgi:hypothetical protein